MENNNNEHNREVADSFEEEFRVNLGTHWKDLTNSLKTIGHQLQLSSEILKNAPPPTLNCSFQRTQVKLKNLQIL